MTSEKLFEILRKDGITRIAIHNNEIVLDHGKGDESVTQLLDERLQLVHQEHGKLKETELKIRRNIPWLTPKVNYDRNLQFIPKTDEELTEDEKIEKQSMLIENIGKMELNNQFSYAYAQLKERYMTGKIKLPIDLQKEKAKFDTENWIEKVRIAGLLSNNFVPFRYCRGVKEQERGVFLAVWDTWFQIGNELRQSERNFEPITDPEIIKIGFGINIEIRLNAIEEEEYKKRIKLLSLSELRNQLDLWKGLAKKSPLRSPNGMVVLQYAPVLLLPMEINERVVDLADDIQKDRDAISDEGVKRILVKNCKEECVRRRLPQKKTLSRKIKFEIAKAIGMEDVGVFESFKSGNSAYHRISNMLSKLGYSEKKPLKYRK